MKKSKKDYDFTGLAYEITGDALYQINGGAVIENSIKAQSEAHEGDVVTNSRNETHKLTQNEIDWAKAEMARREQASATSDPSSNSSPSNKANTNQNSAKDNRETELCINPSNYQDQPTDERGYYSTTANYKNTAASTDNVMKPIKFTRSGSKVEFFVGKNAEGKYFEIQRSKSHKESKSVTDWNEYAEEINLEKEEYMKNHLYDGFDIENKPQKTQVEYQVCTNPDDYHCDILAWNGSLERGFDPRGQNGEVPDLNSINVDTMYDLFTYNRQQGSPEEYTEGYGFYDGTPDKIDNPTHIEFYSYDSGDTFIKYTTDGITTPVPEQRRIDDSRNNNWTFIALPRL